MGLGVLNSADRSSSEMLKQKKLCNGEQNNACCVHYWTGVRGLDSHNPEFLKIGGKVRFCTQWTPEPLQFEEGTTELFTQCSRYTPDHTRPYVATWEDPIPVTGLTEPVIPDAELPPMLEPLSGSIFQSEIHDGDAVTNFKSVGVGIDDALDAPPDDTGTKETA